MSHIKKERVAGFESVHPKVLELGVSVTAELLRLQGIEVTDFVFDYSGNKVREWQGLKILVGLGTNLCRGVGLAIDRNGKLVFVGDDYHQQREFAKIKEKVTQVLGGACYFAARAMIAQAKGQKVHINVDRGHCQLQLVVEME